MEILLVEDNVSEAYLLQQIFAKKQNAPDIHWVCDGQHALDYVMQRNRYMHSERPDLIVLDLNMPRVNGFEVLKTLKDSPVLSTIPVIILTTSKDPLDHSHCKSLGAEMCLAKPHSLKDYEDMVQRLMNWTVLLKFAPPETPPKLN